MTSSSNRQQKNLKPQVQISEMLYDSIRAEIKEKGLKSISVGRMLSKKLGKGFSKSMKVDVSAQVNGKLTKELVKTIEKLKAEKIQIKADYLNKKSREYSLSKELKSLKQKHEEVMKNGEEDRKARDQYKNLRNKAQSALVKREDQLLKEVEKWKIRSCDIQEDKLKKEESFDAYQNKVVGASFWTRFKYLFTGKI